MKTKTQWPKNLNKYLKDMQMHGKPMQAFGYVRFHKEYKWNLTPYLSRLYLLIYLAATPSKKHNISK